MSNWKKIIKNNNPQKYTEIKRQEKKQEIIYNKNTMTVNISTCGWCGQQYTKKANKQKYCSEYCRESARAHQSRMKSHRWYHRHKHELTEKQRWGLGSGVIGQHRHPDYEKEHRVITKELKRIGIYKKNRR